jgi:CheY-like chemotaxis protein
MVKDSKMNSKKVLLIDDEKLLRITTSMLLKHHGFEIITAENGEQGIELVYKHTPDTILLDVMMPDMDGWEVLRRLKTDEKTCSIEIIIFTACDMPVPDDILERFGNFTILKKPFQIQQLLQLVARKGEQ